MFSDFSASNNSEQGDFVGNPDNDVGTRASAGTEDESLTTTFETMRLALLEQLKSNEEEITIYFEIGSTIGSFLYIAYLDNLGKETNVKLFGINVVKEKVAFNQRYDQFDGGCVLGGRFIHGMYNPNSFLPHRAEKASIRDKILEYMKKEDGETVLRKIELENIEAHRLEEHQQLTISNQELWKLTTRRMLNCHKCLTSVIEWESQATQAEIVGVLKNLMNMQEKNVDEVMSEKYWQCSKVKNSVKSLMKETDETRLAECSAAINRILGLVDEEAQSA